MAWSPVEEVKLSKYKTWPQTLFMQINLILVMFHGAMQRMINIRPFEKRDWDATWRIIEPVFRAGETYAFSPDITKEEAHKAWVEVPLATFVAVDKNNDVLGTYYIKPNQPALGAHVCNCGYIVSEDARGKGIAAEMCEHSQREAVSRGFRAMQYNLVVSTNEGAVRLWKRHGFQVIGTLPKAFRHPQLGFVDAFVMYKQLET
jgi:ribosomal protein S18 acetylase RimI-like enzyme